MQVKNDPSASAMNKWGDRDGKFRAIVNPHDIAQPDKFGHVAEDFTDHPAMKGPGQTFKLPAKPFIERHAR